MNNLQEMAWSVIDGFNQKIIALNPIYIDISGSINAGYLLSQMMYWAKTKDYKEFYKTDSDFCAELRMGLKELKNAKEKLREAGIVSITRKGIPAKTYYTINKQRVVELIMNYRSSSSNDFHEDEAGAQITSYAEREQLDVPKGISQLCRKGTTTTESTSESTTDIISRIASDSDKCVVNKKLEKEIKKSEYSQEFQEWWEEVPKKVDKIAASRLFKAVRKRVSQEELVKSMRAYNNHCVEEKTQNRHMISPARWLDKGKWMDELVNGEAVLVATQYQPAEAIQIEPQKPLSEDEQEQLDKIKAADKEIGKTEAKLSLEWKQNRKNKLALATPEEKEDIEKQYIEILEEGNHKYSTAYNHNNKKLIGPLKTLGFDFEFFPEQFLAQKGFPSEQDWIENHSEMKTLQEKKRRIEAGEEVAESKEPVEQNISHFQMLPQINIKKMPMSY